MHNQTFWKDHVTEHPKRRYVIDVGDGLVDLEDAQGRVLQQGTPMSAANFNNMENGIQDAALAGAILAAGLRARDDEPVVFEQASERKNLISGDRPTTLFGKIAKWFADLKAVAFSGKYSDLIDKPTIPTELKNPKPLSFAGGETGSYDGSVAKTVNIPAAATDAPQGPGTASAGKGNTWARADHVHPVQTSVTGSSGSCSGNAASASKLKTENVGSATRPVYFANGVPVQAGKSLEVSVTGSSGSCTGNAASATKLNNVSVNATTLDNTPGSFAFSGNGAPFGNEDWVGLQISSGSDKFQIVARSGGLQYRQNDSGDAAVAWTEWSVLKPVSSLSNLTDGVWKAGQTLKLTNGVFPGYLSGGSKTLTFMIPVGKPITAAGVKATVCTISARGVSGPLATNVNFLASGYSTKAENHGTAGFVIVAATAPSAFSGAVNNTPVTVSGSVTLSFAATADEGLPGPEIFDDGAGEAGPSMAGGDELMESDDLLENEVETV